MLPSIQININVVLLVLFTNMLLFHPVFSIGQYFNLPQASSLQLIKVRQQLFFDQNNTVNVTYSKTKLSQPSAIVSYSQLYIGHNVITKPEIVSWFNVRVIQINMVYVVVYSQSFNQTSGVVGEFHHFDVLLTCINEKYLQVRHWEYTGPRMVADSGFFFPVQITPRPQPFNYCFSDESHTTKQPINFFMSFNGFKAANWLSLNRDVSLHLSRATFHIYPSNASKFQINLYSDHRSWLDTYYLSFGFFCPNSYMLKRKYKAEMYFIAIGAQEACMTYSDYSSQLLTLQGNLNYLQFISYRFMSPNLNKTYGVTFDISFSLKRLEGTAKLQVQAWRLCGRYEINIFYIAQRHCRGSRSLNQNIGQCFCDQTLFYFDVGLEQCELRCPSYLFTVNDTCMTCRQLHGTDCDDCTVTQCTLCRNNFILTGGKCECTSDRFIDTLTPMSQCAMCSAIYGVHCDTCDEAGCLTCINDGYQLVSNVNGIKTCKNCQYLFGLQCLTCSLITCLNCNLGYSVHKNGSCYCPLSSTILLNSLCKACSNLFGLQCLSCIQETCLQCASSFKISSADGSCHCPQPSIIVSSGSCLSCSSLFGMQCKMCTQFQCLQCIQGYILNTNHDKCICDKTKRFLTQNETCLNCAEVLGINFCLECNQIQCLKCMQNLTLQNGTCKCQKDRFLFNQKCLLCQNVFSPGCGQCNQLRCLKCKQNWKSYPTGEQCRCQKPNQIQLVNGKEQCLKCQDIQKDLRNCQLLIFHQHTQIGSSIFVQLKFNHPFSELAQIIPLESNLLIKQGQIVIEQVKWHKELLMLQIQLNQQQFKQQDKLTIQIVNPQYLKWNNLPLTKPYIQIRIQPFVTAQNHLGLGILSQLSIIIEWVYPISLVLSLGQLSFGFQMWFMLGYYIYVRQDLFGMTQHAIYTISKAQLCSILPAGILSFLPQIQHDQVDFKQKLFHKNKGILQYSFQIFIIYSVSLLIVLSLKHYVKQKDYRKYGVYSNIIKHYKEYVFADFFAIYPFLAFSIAVQVESLVKSQWQMSAQNIFTNAMVSLTIILIMLFTPFLALNIFPPYQAIAQSHYSIIYNKMHPCGIFVFLEHFMRIFKTSIFVTIIFICRDSFNLMCQLLLLGFMLFYLLVTIINFRKYFNKIYWTFNFIKSLFLISFQIGFLFLPTLYPQNIKDIGQASNFGTDETCFYLVLVLVMVQFTQFIVKLVLLVLKNKFNWEEVHAKSNKIIPTTTTQIQQQLYHNNTQQNKYK